MKSRNQREGRYVGFAWGHHVRKRMLYYTAIKPRRIHAREVLRERRKDRFREFAARIAALKPYVDALDGALRLDDPKWITIKFERIG